MNTNSYNTSFSLRELTLFAENHQNMVIEQTDLVYGLSLEEAQSLFLTSVKINNFELLEYLIDEFCPIGLNLDKNNGEALFYAVRNINIKMVNHLLECGARATLRGTELVDWSCSFENIDILDALIAAGAPFQGEGFSFHSNGRCRFYMSSLMTDYDSVVC